MGVVLSVCAGKGVEEFMAEELELGAGFCKIKNAPIPAAMIAITIIGMINLFILFLLHEHRTLPENYGNFRLSLSVYIDTWAKSSFTVRAIFPNRI